MCFPGRAHWEATIQIVPDFMVSAEGMPFSRDFSGFNSQTTANTPIEAKGLYLKPSNPETSFCWRPLPITYATATAAKTAKLRVVSHWSSELKVHIQAGLKRATTYLPTTGTEPKAL